MWTGWANRRAGKAHGALEQIPPELRSPCPSPLHHGRAACGWFVPGRGGGVKKCRVPGVIPHTPGGAGGPAL